MSLYRAFGFVVPYCQEAYIIYENLFKGRDPITVKDLKLGNFISSNWFIML